MLLVDDQVRLPVLMDQRGLADPPHIGVLIDEALPEPVKQAAE